MSAPEEYGQQAEQKSSVEITLSATHKPHARVKVYAGDTEEDVSRAREIAVATFLKTLEAIGVAA